MNWKQNTMLIVKLWGYLSYWVILIMGFFDGNPNEIFGAPDGFWYAPVIILQHLILYPLWIFIWMHTIYPFIKGALKEI